MEEEKIYIPAVLKASLPGNIKLMVRGDGCSQKFTKSSGIIRIQVVSGDCTPKYSFSGAEDCYIVGI